MHRAGLKGSGMKRIIRVKALIAALALSAGLAAAGTAAAGTAASGVRADAATTTISAFAPAPASDADWGD